MAAGNGDDLVARLKEQRDRFIAFAFAGADLLLELDDSDVVVYSAGAGEALYGMAENAMLAHKLAEFVHPRDGKRLEEALQRLRNTGRLDHTPLSVMGDGGTVTRMRMAGIRLPQMKTCHLALSRIPPIAVTEEDGRERADPKARFVEVVRQRLNEANRTGQEVMVTLVDLSGTDLRGLEPAKAQSLLATLHNALEEVSVGGTSAGPLSGHAFGVVHSDRMSPQALAEHLDTVTRRFADAGGNALRLRSSSLKMEDSALGEEDIAKALTYIVNAFVRDSAAFAIRSLTDGARIAVDDTLTRVRNFRAMVKNDRLAFLFQPVVNLHTGVVLNFEVFTRLAHGKNLFTPAQILPFATDVGLVGEFDLAVCRKVLDTMRAATEISTLASVAVNVSGHSLANPLFYKALLATLQQNKTILGRLIIEVTDPAGIANMDEARRLLARLRKLGVRVALDDFGSGSASFDMLRTLPVDYVKLDAKYIEEARHPKGFAMLRAMAGLCRELEVITVGERVEDAPTLHLLRDAGVDYAQGHFFDRPTAGAARKVARYDEHVRRAGTAQVAAAG